MFLTEHCIFNIGNFLKYSKEKKSRSINDFVKLIITLIFASKK